MGWPLRVLVVEDSPDAADRIIRALGRGGIDAAWERVATAAALRAALAAGPWGAVLAAPVEPDLGAAAALELVRAADPDLPFIVVAGAVEVDAAVEVMRTGANDYISAHALDRLAPAVEREVRKAAGRRAAARPAAVADEHFRQARKMEVVGRLAGGVAHDFNNLLTVINGCSDLLLQNLPPNDPARELVTEIHKAGERSAGLTRQLLAFIRQRILAPRVIDLNAVFADTEGMLRRLTGDGVRLSAALGPDLWAVRADPGQVGQVLMNLATNARDAMPHGGRVAIETRNVELDDAHARAHPGARPGPHVLLSVTDTGSGMPPDVKARLFEPYFTTKEPGRGTGLGLATVYAIVKQAGGHVAVASEVGVGTTFRVYLPRVDKAVDGSEAAARRALPRGAETVLVVDGQDRVRALTRRVLSGCGYSVLEAADAGEAARVAAEHAGPIHLVIADVLLPGASGRAVAERLVERHPGVRVVLVSGYPDDASVWNVAPCEGANFLQKPFTPLALALKVRAVLDAPPGG